MVFGVCREMALVNGGGDTFEGEKGIVLLSKRKREQRLLVPMHWYSAAPTELFSRSHFGCYPYYTFYF